MPLDQSGAEEVADDLSYAYTTLLYEARIFSYWRRVLEYGAGLQPIFFEDEFVYPKPQKREADTSSNPPCLPA
jgi:hypothetical protein